MLLSLQPSRQRSIFVIESPSYIVFLLKTSSTKNSDQQSEVIRYSMTSKPVIVFAPGAWHSASCYDKIRNSLRTDGWETEAVEYPSVGAEPPTKHMAEDAAAIRAVLIPLVEQGKEIILVVHSYGGVPGASAIQGLGWKQRAKEGKTGGISILVYLAAFVTPKGKTPKDLLGGEFLPWMSFDVSCASNVFILSQLSLPSPTFLRYAFVLRNDRLPVALLHKQGNYSHADTPETIFYHDLNATDLKWALDNIKHQSAPIFTDVADYEPWHDIDCGFIICDDDQAIPKPIQEQLASILGPDAFVTHLKASHSPFLSVVPELAGALEKAAVFAQGRIAA